jgi:hypothetical protein
MIAGITAQMPMASDRRLEAAVASDHDPVSNFMGQVVPGVWDQLSFGVDAANTLGDASRTRGTRGIEERRAQHHHVHRVIPLAAFEQTLVVDHDS